MKKLIALTALALAATASYAGTSAFVTYDYDRANGDQGGSQQEVAVGVAVATVVGTLDGALLGKRHSFGQRDDGLGFEVGYSNGLTVMGVDLTGRAAYGRINQIDVDGGGFTGNAQYYSLAAEASLPVTSSIDAFVGYRHRNALNEDTPAAINRWTAGADLSLSKSFSVRLGYAHTRQADRVMNGLTSAVQYKF